MQTKLPISQVLAQKLSAIAAKLSLSSLETGHPMLLCLERGQSGQSAVFEVLHYTSEGFHRHPHSYTADEIFRHLSLADSAQGWVDLPADIFQSILKGVELWPGAEHPHRAVPLSLSAGPLGFLLLPHTSQAPASHDFHPFLSALLWEGLTEDLYKAFSTQDLGQITDSITFFKRFVQTLIPWLAPHRYRLSTSIADPYGSDEVNYLTEWSEVTNLMELAFTAPTGEVFVTQWWLPSQRSGFKAGFLPQHLVNLVLQGHFASLFGQWKAQGLSQGSYPMPIDLVNQALDVIQEQVRTLRDLVESPREVGDIPAHEQSPGHEVVHFALFQDTSHWVFFFKGEKITIPLGKADQGLESIRLLLAQPEQDFSPLAFRDMNVFGKEKTRGRRKGDPEKDYRNREDLVQLWEALKSAEADSSKRSRAEQLEYWTYRRHIADLLYRHAQIARYLKDYNLCSQRLEDLDSGKQDELFNDPYKSILKELQPDITEKYTLDSLTSGMKKAFALLSDCPELHHYLQETIILRNRGHHRPFIYLPGLYTGTDATLRRLSFWKTNP